MVDTVGVTAPFTELSIEGTDLRRVRAPLFCPVCGMGVILKIDPEANKINCPSCDEEWDGAAALVVWLRKNSKECLDRNLVGLARMFRRYAQCIENSVYAHFAMIICIHCDGTGKMKPYGTESDDCPHCKEGYDFNDYH